MNEKRAKLLSENFSPIELEIIGDALAFRADNLRWQAKERSNSTIPTNTDDLTRMLGEASYLEQVADEFYSGISKQSGKEKEDLTNEWFHQ